MESTPPIRIAIIAAALLLLAALAFPLTARGQTVSDRGNEALPEVFTPKVAPELRVHRAPGPITIDGVLEDPGWANAARATGFSENYPKEQGEPAVRSEVLVTYDQDHLYLGFVAYDAPGSIRTSLHDRDEIWADDYFGILLDTYGDASWAYYLFANPMGVQGDERFSSTSGEDESFDIIYTTAARVTEHGYQIEMAIPFASLRFPNRTTQTWRATFWRTRPRSSRFQYTWAAMDRSEPCFLCQFGTITGIEGVKPGGSLELLPAITASQAAVNPDVGNPENRLVNDNITGDVSLGVRYAFAGGLTAEAALNPDFSQVESDAAQIDVNSNFALFFPERRPFFQEGSDLFSTYFDVVYTRSINDPVAAVKLIGRRGRTSVAYLGARDQNSPILLPLEERSFVGRGGKSFTNIGRFQQSLGGESYLGALVTDRRFEGGGSGTTGGVDGNIRFGKYSVEYQLLGSYVKEPNDPTLTADLDGVRFDDGRHTATFDGESFWGYGQYTSVERSARTWSFDFDYWSASPSFRADNGFEGRNDYRRVAMWQGLSFYPASALIDQVRPSIYVRRTWNTDGIRKGDVIQPSLNLNLVGQTYLYLSFLHEFERYRDVDFDGLNRWQMELSSRFSQPLSLGVWVSRGRGIARFNSPPTIGTGTNLSVWGTIRPTSRFAIEPQWDYSDLGPLDGGGKFFSGSVYRIRSNYQFTREFFLRLVVQYNTFDRGLSIEPLLTYKVNPFTLVFLGSSHAYQDPNDPRGLSPVSRQFFAKFQYLIRR